MGKDLFLTNYTNKKGEEKFSLGMSKQFINSLITNVYNMLLLINKKKFNSIILNYDKTADNFLKWYQQLVAESLGKKGNGIFPITSNIRL